MNDDVKGVQLPEPGPVDVTYYPQDAIENAIKSSVAIGAAGLFVGAIQNTVAKENVGAFGVFSRFGNTAALFGQ